MKWFQAPLLGFLLLVSTTVNANNNAASNVGRADCGCHSGGGSISLSAAQGFVVVDPDTNAAIRQYEPGKVYTIRIAFNGMNSGGSIRNAYVLTIADISSGLPVPAGSIIDTGSIGSVDAARQSNSRIIEAAVRNAADNAEVSWLAPSQGRIRLTLLRMESNRNGNSNGDRISLAPEGITLTAVSSTTSPDPDDDMEEEDESDSPPLDSDDLNDESEETSSAASSFAQRDFSGGCGILTSSRSSPSLMISILLILLALGQWLSSRRVTLQTHHSRRKKPSRHRQ